MPYLPPIFPKARARQKTARALYEAVINHSRDPIFYTDYNVPDTFDGRYEIVALHVALIINRLKQDGADGAKLAQALFDTMFLNLELACREMGIGDLSVPRHMKRMMTGLHGRAHAYQNDNLDDAIIRNIYGTIPDMDKQTVSAMRAYIEQLQNKLEQCKIDDIKTIIENFVCNGVNNEQEKQSA